MLAVAKEIFDTHSIEEGESGKRVKLHSHTSMEQCLFIQGMMDEVKPLQSIEVGLAYGISSMFILEKHQQYGSANEAHIIIEPFPWGNTALHNFRKAGVERYAKIINKLSDEVLPALYAQKHRIQFAYLDTTKLFDVVLHDFYFVDKMLDVNGVVIIDDCDTTGINLVARFIKSLDHYEIAGANGKIQRTAKLKMLDPVVRYMLKLIPFKERIFPNYSFKSSRELEIDYRCIAFRKIAEDKRTWDAKQAL